MRCRRVRQNCRMSSHKKKKKKKSDPGSSFEDIPSQQRDDKQAWSHLFRGGWGHRSRCSIATQLIVKGANIPAGLDLLIHVIVFHTHCMIYYCKLAECGCSESKHTSVYIGVLIAIIQDRSVSIVFARQLDDVFLFVIMSHLCRSLLSFCCPAWTRSRVRVNVRVLQYTMWPAGCAIGLTECRLKGFPFNNMIPVIRLVLCWYC